MNLSKKKINFITLFAVIVFLTTNNFFYNLYFTFKSSYFDRMKYHYGYCDKSGFGFISYINNKYKLSKNIKIFNFIEQPNSEWFFFKPNVDYYSKKLILLNKNNLLINKEGIFKADLKEGYQGNFKVIEKYENCFFIEKLDD